MLPVSVSLSALFMLVLNFPTAKTTGNRRRHRRRRRLHKHTIVNPIKGKYYIINVYVLCAYQSTVFVCIFVVNECAQQRAIDLKRARVCVSECIEEESQIREIIVEQQQYFFCYSVLSPHLIILLKSFIVCLLGELKCVVFCWSVLVSCFVCN